MYREGLEDKSSTGKRRFRLNVQRKARRRVGTGVVKLFPRSATEPSSSSSQEGVEATAKPMKHASLLGIELTIDLVVMGLSSEH